MAAETAKTDDLDALVHHLAEALRITRTHPGVPVSVYNKLGDLINDHITNPLLEQCDTFEFLQFALTKIAAQGKGGVK